MIVHFRCAAFVMQSVAFAAAVAISEELDDMAPTILVQRQLELDLSGVMLRPYQKPLLHPLPADDKQVMLQARQETPVELLVLIVSCHANADKWPDLVQWAESVHPSGRVLILAGFPPTASFQPEYHLSLTNKTLFVNASDAYDGLPDKVVRGFSSVLHAPELQNATHVFKVDDTSVLDPAKLWADSSFSSLEQALAGQLGDYFGPEYGYITADCSVPRSLYWHVTKGLPNTSYWQYRLFICNDTFAYANGETGYIVSRRAVGIISDRWPVESASELYHSQIFEDYNIGLTLSGAGVTLTPIHVTALPEWNRKACPCELPCLHENSSIVLETIYHKYCNESVGEMCCFGHCRENDGLCSSTVHM